MSKSIFLSALFVLAWPFSALAQSEHLCRPTEIQPSPFFSNLLGSEKAQAHVKIRKKCIDIGPEGDMEFSDADGYVLDVEVGVLTYTEFLNFKTKFGELSQVSYEPSRTYNLIDFLPPAMQAMVNKNFKTNSYSELDEMFSAIENEELSWMFRSGISSSSNCWNTVIENIRLMSNPGDAATGDYRLYWPGRWEVSEALFDNEYSVEVPRSEARFGDVVLVYIEKQFLEDGKPSGEPQSELQHAAVVLTEQLVYEKVDSSDYHPYRIALFDETPEKIKRFFGEDLINDEYQKQTLKVQVRRFDYKKFAESPVSKPAPYDLVEGMYGFEDDAAKAKYQAAVDLLPRALLDLHLTVGCETGLGGGCSQQVTAVQRLKVSVNPKTGLGELLPITIPDAFTEKYTGGTQVIERFVEVPYIN